MNLFEQLSNLHEITGIDLDTIKKVTVFVANKIPGLRVEGDDFVVFQFMGMTNEYHNAMMEDIVIDLMDKKYYTDDIVAAMLDISRSTISDIRRKYNNGN